MDIFIFLKFLFRKLLILKKKVDCLLCFFNVLSGKLRFKEIVNYLRRENSNGS